MAEQARVGAVFRAETNGHLSIRDIVDLVRARTEQYAIHDAGHMAGDTTAGLYIQGMMRVRCSPAGVTKL
jgi:hypothetical protein